MKHTRFFSVLSLILALVTALILPLQVMAESEQEYICAIEIGYGDEGKQALIDAGYQVWTNLNANEGVAGSSVWLGYLTTANRSDAITDIALMNMEGGYSFDAYKAEVAEMQQKVQEMLVEFRDAITEFRTNYQNGSVLAQKAADIMNYFVEDDSGEGIGDIILNASTADETLTKIFLQGNTEVLDIVEKALALGCGELGSDTFLTRLANEEYSDEISPELNVTRSRLTSVFSAFHSTMVSVTEEMEKADAAESREAYFESLSDSMKTQYLYSLALYEATTSTDFADTGMTLYDFGMLDTVNENEDGWVVDDDLLDLLAKAMTPGQRGVVFSVGISNIVMNASIPENTIDANMNVLFNDLNGIAAKSISVYSGVDRTLFTDMDSVALTSAALCEKAASQQSEFGKSGTLGETAKRNLTIIGGVTAGIGALALIGGILMQATYKFTYVGGNSFFFSHLVETCCFGAYSSTLSTVAIIGGAITLLVGLFLLCAALQGFIVKPETNKVKYTAIPRVLVDLKYDEFGEKKYYNYYAAKSINPPEDMTESLALYGDLNALTTEYQWDALYYTKDPRVGTPLTAEIVVQNKNSLDLGQQEYYTPIHRFSSDVAADLNQYNGSATQTYVFVRKSGTSGTLGGSVFSEHPISTAIVSFIVGGGLAAGITYAMTRAKYKKEDSVA